MFKVIPEGIVLIFFIFITALCIAACIPFFFSAQAATVSSIGPRTPIKEVPFPLYALCSSYTPLGEPCIWNAGIDIPLKSTEQPHYTTMVTLVLPPTNQGWTLHRSDFTFTLDFVYQNDCRNSVIYYKNDANLYLNDTVCK